MNLLPIRTKLADKVHDKLVGMLVCPAWSNARTGTQIPWSCELRNDIQRSIFYQKIDQ
jgi:hypothetical protein